MAQLIKSRTPPQKWLLKSVRRNWPTKFKIDSADLKLASDFDSDFSNYLHELKVQAAGFREAIKKTSQRSFLRGKLKTQAQIAVEMIFIAGLWQMHAEEESKAIIKLASYIAHDITKGSYSFDNTTIKQQNIKETLLDMFYTQLHLPLAVSEDVSRNFVSLSKFFCRDFFVPTKNLANNARICVTCIDSEINFDIDLTNLNRVLQSTISCLKKEKRVVI